MLWQWRLTLLLLQRTHGASGFWQPDIDKLFRLWVLRFCGWIRASFWWWLAHYYAPRRVAVLMQPPGSSTPRQPAGNEKVASSQWRNASKRSLNNGQWPVYGGVSPDLFWRLTPREGGLTVLVMAAAWPVLGVAAAVR